MFVGREVQLFNPCGNKKVTLTLSSGFVIAQLESQIAEYDLETKKTTLITFQTDQKHSHTK